MEPSEPPRPATTVNAGAGEDKPVQSTLAVAGFVLAILALALRPPLGLILAPLALALGLLGRWRIRRAAGQVSGVGMANAAIAIGFGGTVLMSLSTLAVARDDARRREVRVRLQTVGTAVRIYHDFHRAFPPAWTADQGGRHHHGWIALILPMLGQEQLYGQINFERPWDDPANAAAWTQKLTHFLTPGQEPTRDSAGRAVSHFAAVGAGGDPGRVGATGCWVGNVSIRLQDITDGTAATLMAGQVQNAPDPWGSPWNTRPIEAGINTGLPRSFGSPFAGGHCF